MFETLYHNSEVVFSIKARNECESCGFIGNENFCKYVPMSFKGDWKENIRNLQSCVDTDKLFSEKICGKCEIPLDTHVIINNVLALHIELAYPNTLIHKIELN